jgi:protoporphyrin/coproporphyrin ferrochelatase
VKQGVLLLAHGAPERVEDVEPYLGFVRAGRPPNPAIIEEVKHRYAAIGGSSPLTHWTRVQAEALQQFLGIPVFFAMRNWHPFIRETVDAIRTAGVERLAGICLAPQYSTMSVGLYIKRTEEAWGTDNIVWAKSYHDEPLLIEAFVDRLRPVAAGRKVIFTAHSLPEKALAGGDPYDRECRHTAEMVAASAGVTDWKFAYQSQGMTSDAWLGPTVESLLDRFEGTEVVIDPIGFVCDHVEVLYDIDIGFREYGAARGIAVHRPESLNGSPAYTAALAAVARRCLA